MRENTREWHYKHVSASEVADGIQLVFENSLDSEQEYLLIQRHLEPPDNGQCYIETDDPAFRGHFRIRNAQLSRNRLLISFGDPPCKKVVVLFKASDLEYLEVTRVLRLMVPHLEVT